MDQPLDVHAVFNDPHGSAHIYASTQTQDHLGWITSRLSEIAGVPTLILNREDIFPDGKFSLVRTPGRLEEAFHSAGFPSKQIGIGIKNLITSNLYDRNISAILIDLEKDGKTDYGVIVTPDLNITPEKFTSLFLNIPPDKIAALPGDGEDYIAFAMFHEAAHLAQPNPYGDMPEYMKSDLNPLQYEMNADFVAKTAFNKAVAQGMPLDPQVTDTAMGIRFAASLLESGGIVGMALGPYTPSGEKMQEFLRTPSHMTGAALSEDSVLPLTPEGLTPLAGELMVSQITNIALGMMTSLKSALSPDDVAYNPLKMAQIGSIQGLKPGSSIAALEVLKEKGYFSNIDGAQSYCEKAQEFYNRHIPDFRDFEGYRETKSLMQNLPSAGSKNALDFMTAALVWEDRDEVIKNPGFSLSPKP